MPTKLTDSLIKQLQAPVSGASTIWDSEVNGFGVRVFAPSSRSPGGGRSFFLNYRRDGTERRVTIGAYPTWTTKAARDEATELRRCIDRGEDPASDKRARREAPTVKVLAVRYRTEHLTKKAVKSQHEDWTMIEREILPRIGDRKVQDVHFGDIQSLHRQITESGRPVRANRVLAVASKMFSLTLKPAAGEDRPWRDFAAGNPCKGIERNPEEGHERFLSEAELAALGDALSSYKQRAPADCIGFIMLTGCRPGEAMAATWEQMDAEPGFWVKPSAHVKQRKIHRAALSPPAIELLERRRKVRDAELKAGHVVSDYVFPGRERERLGRGTKRTLPNEPLQQLRSCWQAVTDRATIALWENSPDERIAKLMADLKRALKREPTFSEYREFARRAKIELPPGLTDARIYDLRHTFASVGAGGGLSLLIIGRLLGHTQGRTTARYSHLADDATKAAAAKIGSVIANAGKAGNAEIAGIGKARKP